MKHVLKRNIPGPFLRIMSHLLRRQRTRPYVTHYQGENASVLQCCISYNKYGGYCVPLSSLHRPAAQKILSGDIWEPDTIEFMRRNSAGGDIIHAGTYFGDFIPALSMSCANGAKIWAFEPNPENYRCARLTVHINALKNVEIMNAGLGVEKGLLSMMTHDENGKSLGGASRLNNENRGKINGQFVEVEMVCVDDVVPADRKISIIQLDVEGFEKSALNGSIRTIKRCQPVLILEDFPEEAWLEEHIFSLGYRESGMLHANTILRTTK